MGLDSELEIGLPRSCHRDTLRMLRCQLQSERQGLPQEECASGQEAETNLSYSVNCLSYSDRHGEQLALCIQRHEHAGPEGGGQQVEEVWVIASQCGLHVQCAVHDSQNASQRTAWQASWFSHSLKRVKLTCCRM